eukprot:CAMPEP_0185043440 /NCGR_PEP_ID=MMETSP1103-20130426/42903_1 /TAXON_ID=36769 /ORGANISM="Paraphysomonas bandaiensis, Strain Caron Lab Isolate" /LENGTH=408 /DNA_ID=CAMNT_0027583613 /DNA_START=775 /DNA_END=2002 /DNA_ORIENTATION=+
MVTTISTVVLELSESSLYNEQTVFDLISHDTALNLSHFGIAGFDSNFSSHIHVLPPGLMNSDFPSFLYRRSDSPVLHLAGERHQYRETVFRGAWRELCTEWANRGNDWSLKLSSTSRESLSTLFLDVYYAKIIASIRLLGMKAAKQEKININELRFFAITLFRLFAVFQFKSDRRHHSQALQVFRKGFQAVSSYTSRLRSVYIAEGISDNTEWRQLLTVNMEIGIGLMIAEKEENILKYSKQIESTIDELLDIWEDSPTSKGSVMGLLYTNKGLLNMYLNHNFDSLEYFLKAFTIYKALSISYGNQVLVNIQELLGVVYAKLEQYNDAIMHFEKSIQLSMWWYGGKEHHSMAVLYLNYATALIKGERKEKGLIMLQRSLELFEGSGYPESHSSYSVARLYYSEVSSEI